VIGGYDRRQHNPHDIGGTQTYGERPLLGEHAIVNSEDDIDRIDGKARHRALRDELCVVIERKKYVNRPRSDRQRRHQPADQRAGTLGRDCRRQHESRV
jgi:hypothetical protein